MAIERRDDDGGENIEATRLLEEYKKRLQKETIDTTDIPPEGKTKMELSRKRKKRQQMKKFIISLTINGISGSSRTDAEERLRCFIFKNRRNWELDIMGIEEVGK